MSIKIKGKNIGAYKKINPRRAKPTSTAIPHFPIHSPIFLSTTSPYPSRRVFFNPFALSYGQNRKNFLKWSHIVQMYLKGKGKLQHLIGLEPAKTDPRLTVWDKEDSMIMSWFCDSIELSINDTCIFL